ncbi:MAG: hypothetical protein DRP06_03620 [Candidatus Aenigmatarchaeota archaeon]|nr:MAG: hypothetical protein DRP06_03620 [Candidatus Aenigmarchaeota archaeon]
MMVKEINKANKLKVIAIGAHPDDFEIGAGMRLMHHVKNGDEVIGIICSDGEQGGDGEIRLKEAEYAAKFVGIKELYKLHFPDTRFPNYLTIKDRLEKIIKKENPSIAYIHFKEDQHQDHRVVSLASSIACRKVLTILNYKSPSTINALFNPHLFHIGLKKDFQKKMELLKIYKSQIERNGVLDLRHAEIEAKYHASSIHFPENHYAEPFCANHIILNKMVGYDD